LNETYRRYLEARVRKSEPYPGVPIFFTLRRRGKTREK
jgi:predicted GTPase